MITRQSILETCTILWGGCAMFLAFTLAVKIYDWAIYAGFGLMFFIGLVSCLLIEFPEEKVKQP